MATYQDRLAEFTVDGEPPVERPQEILCRDHVGTYAPPFRCRWSGGAWFNCDTGEQVDAEVLGWREPRAKAPLRR